VVGLAEAHELLLGEVGATGGRGRDGEEGRQGAREGISRQRHEAKRECRRPWTYISRYFTLCTPSTSLPGNGRTSDADDDDGGCGGAASTSIDASSGGSRLSMLGALACESFGSEVAPAGACPTRFSTAVLTKLAMRREAEADSTRTRARARTGGGQATRNGATTRSTTTTAAPERVRATQLSLPPSGAIDLWLHDAGVSISRPQREFTRPELMQTEATETIYPKEGRLGACDGDSD
jgi:hypothetical protein